MAVQFVSRQQWGAKPPRSVTRRSPPNLAGVAVHWFGKPAAAASHDGCAALLRSVQQTHMAPGGLGTKDGANDIAYNHAVCPHGHAFTLRGFGVQTGANGDTSSNRAYAAVVYMGGTGDRPTPAALPVLADVIRTWQAKGAGPLVKPHGFFTGSDCPGPDLDDWLKVVPHPWVGEATPVVPEDETPEWLLDFISWRLADNADPKRRPKHLPKPVPASAFEAAAQMDRMANLMGPQQSFLDWAEWRRQGAKKAERPRSLPREIPSTWWEALERLERIFKGVKSTTKAPTGRKPRTQQPTRPKSAEATAVGSERLSTKTGLLAPPRTTEQGLERYVLAREHGSYTEAQVRGILKKYVATCAQAGLDPLLVVSQMLLETGNLTSHWSQPPRRNPAGIGVTGEPGAGISFPSWDKAVRAHVGRLLAYAIPKGGGSKAQRDLIKEALAVRPLPDDRRGCAPTIEGLAGTWATDREYAGKITRIANEIQQAA